MTLFLFLLPIRITAAASEKIGVLLKDSFRMKINVCYKFNILSFSHQSIVFMRDSQNSKNKQLTLLDENH
jgi:hypothetical protein